MILNPNVYNETTITITLVVCCLIVLATVMLPKVIRHRKKVRENSSKETVPNETPEVEMMIVPTDQDTLPESATDYKKRFLVNAGIPTRSGKPVIIRRKYHNRISKIVQVAGANDVTIFSYIDNILNHHFETFQEDISELYKEQYDDDYFNLQK